VAGKRVGEHEIVVGLELGCLEAPLKLAGTRSVIGTEREERRDLGVPNCCRV
jgi:hypothetical protein